MVKTDHPRGVARIAGTVLLALALLVMTPLSAFAEVAQSDYIGSKTIAQRGTVIDAPDIDATCAILETEDGTVLWSRNADTQCAMASTTKIMTCLLAVENLDLNGTVTIPEEATTVGESSCYLTAGATCNTSDLLTAMMLKSGNDAAVAVAVAVAGSVDAFVEMMNAKAAELGMTNTQFYNPHGLLGDPSNHTTASDYALLARTAMANETFKKIVGTQSIDCDLGSGEVSFTNTNRCLFTLDGCIGIKTGTEDDAGYCVVTCTERDGETLYAVIFGSSTDQSRFDSATTLTDWGYRHYHAVELGSTDDTAVQAVDTDWLDVTVPLAQKSTKTVRVLDYDGSITPTVTLGSVSGIITKGKSFGTITWMQGSTTLLTSDLIATESVTPPGPVDILTLWYLRNVHHADELYKTEVLVGDIDLTDPYETSADKISSLAA